MTDLLLPRPDVVVACKQTAIGSGDSDVRARLESGIEVLIHSPYFGSLWLNNAEWNGDFVVGDCWDDGEAGSPYMPDDYRGEYVMMNFPISCVDKVRHNDSPFWIRRREEASRRAVAEEGIWKRTSGNQPAIGTPASTQPKGATQ